MKCQKDEDVVADTLICIECVGTWERGVPRILLVPGGSDCMS